MRFSKKNKTVIYHLQKIICFFLFLILFYSCAIHKKFPYICFRYECIKAQLKFPVLKANLKKNKAIAAAKRRKRNGTNKETARIKEITKPGISKSENDAEPVNSARDSVFTVISPDKSQKPPEILDTIFVFSYFLYEDVISDEDKSQLKKFLSRIGPAKVSQIRIKGYADAAENKRYKGKALDRAKKAYKLLGKLGIPSYKLMILKPEENDTPFLKRTIEIRVQ